MFKRILATLVIATLLVSCVTPQQSLRSDIPIETLNIYMKGTTLMPPSVLAGFDKELDEFIAQHNREPHKFKLARSNSHGERTISIMLHEMRFVTSDQQALGVVASLFGLSLPFIMVGVGSPFYVFFYYFPTVKTMTETSLSNDIDNSIANPAIRRYDSPGFLKNPEKQESKHIELFDKYYLKRLIRELEKSYKPK